MIACWECRNLTAFVQVSGRQDARPIEQTTKGPIGGAWELSDERPAGLYCSTCSRPVEADLDELGLRDQRQSFVPPAEFDASALAEELRSLRPDAVWSELELPASEPVFGDLPEELPGLLVEALRRTNRLPLYSHQSESIEHGLKKRHTVIATPAGSGKSIGLLAPVLARLIEDPDATAILCFPLKALANDQMAAIARLGLKEDPWLSTSAFELDLGGDHPPIVVGRYDGATPQHERELIRKRARILVTNPDMLHVGVLPRANSPEKNGTMWKRFFQNLDYVVLDEIHTYQGVFGSNVALVLRRLRRVARAFDRSPTFLTASATIGNPIELAQQLTGQPDFQLVDNDGAGRARRLVLVCNPPLRRSDSAGEGQEDSAGEPGDEGRIAPQTIAIDLIADGALASDRHLPVRTIAFARSRTAVFQLSKRLQGKLKDLKHPALAEAVAPYAATFLDDDRAEAEGRLRDGSTLAIISTSALELGIDIPDLSLAVLVGYPGQVSSFRQRAGRVGRSGEGLAVLIVGDDPLQQFLARDPAQLQELLDGAAEDVVVNPRAPELARRFGLVPSMNDLGGLAFEDAEFFDESLVEEFLGAATGPPDRTIGDRHYWMVHGQDEIDGGLRSAASNETYTVIHQNRREFKAIGRIDAATAPRDAFVPAVWNGPKGETFVVTGFDLKTREVFCEGPVDLGYVTRGISIDQVDAVFDHEPAQTLGGSSYGYSSLRISRHVVGYREAHFAGPEFTRKVERRWPSTEFLTDGLTLTVDETWLDGNDRDGTMTALEHVLLAVAPVVVASDPNDFEATSNGMTLYLYDSFGGGLQMSAPLHRRLDEVARLAYEIVAACECSKGCPSCVMLSRRPEGNRGLSKAGALNVLELLNRELAG